MIDKAKEEMPWPVHEVVKSEIYLTPHGDLDGQRFALITEPEAHELFDMKKRSEKMERGAKILLNMQDDAAFCGAFPDMDSPDECRDFENALKELREAMK